MTTVPKWEYLTAWRYTGNKTLKGKGFMGGDKKIPIEVLEVSEELGTKGYFPLGSGLNQLGAEGWELVTETSRYRQYDTHTDDYCLLLFKRPVEAGSPYLVAAA